MTTTLRALPVAGLAALACLTLAACGGSEPATPAAPPVAAGASAPPAAPVRTGAEAEVEAVFHAYYRSLLARDFAGACAFNAPETTDQLLATLRQQGVTASTCEEGLSAIYSMPGAEATADTIANTAAVDTITVDGEDASITWSAEIEGQRPTVTSGLRRVDGRWVLVDTGR
jgi:predicted outer membrane protein